MASASCKDRTEIASTSTLPVHLIPMDHSSERRPSCNATVYRPSHTKSTTPYENTLRLSRALGLTDALLLPVALTLPSRKIAPPIIDILATRRSAFVQSRPPSFYHFPTEDVGHVYRHNRLPNCWYHWDSDEPLPVVTDTVIPADSQSPNTKTLRPRRSILTPRFGIIGSTFNDLDIQDNPLLASTDTVILADSQSPNTKTLRPRRSILTPRFGIIGSTFIDLDIQDNPLLASTDTVILAWPLRSERTEPNTLNPRRSDPDDSCRYASTHA